MAGGTSTSRTRRAGRVAARITRFDPASPRSRMLRGLCCFLIDDGTRAKAALATLDRDPRETVVARWEAAAFLVLRPLPCVPNLYPPEKIDSTDMTRKSRKFGAVSHDNY